MRWRIEGADERTGKELALLIDAVDQERAEADARYRGIMISSIAPDPPPGAPVVDYRTPSAMSPTYAPQSPSSSGAILEQQATAPLVTTSWAKGRAARGRRGFL